MTTKEAADRFNIPEQEIRRLCKENKIRGVTKSDSYSIPDDTVMIIRDKDAKAFLLQVLKLKNNPSLVLPVSGLDTPEKLCVWYDYMTDQGLIGACEYSDDPRTLLLRMQLTEEAFSTILGKTNYSKLVQINLNPSFNLNAIKI